MSDLLENARQNLAMAFKNLEAVFEKKIEETRQEFTKKNEKLKNNQEEIIDEVQASIKIIEQILRKDNADS